MSKNVEQEWKQREEELEKRLGYVFKDKELLALAFSHSSYVNEQKGKRGGSGVWGHNERLEFLGDAVLETLISSYLYGYLPTAPEGVLSKFKAQLVEKAQCVTYLDHLDVARFLLLGKGERKNQERAHQSLLGNLFEAILGAIHLDGGYEAARLFFFSHFEEEVRRRVAEPILNWKAQLQEIIQKKSSERPRYALIAQEGSDHERLFTVEVFLGELSLGSGKGTSKKRAEQEAAKEALITLQETKFSGKRED